MARMARAEVFAPDEVAVVHVMNRVVRRCYLLGDDLVSGKRTGPWGHCADLKICCDFAQIVPVSGFDHI